MVPFWKLGPLTAAACLGYAAAPLAGPILPTIQVEEGKNVVKVQTVMQKFTAVFRSTIDSVMPSDVFLGGDTKDALATVKIVANKCTKGLILKPSESCTYDVTFLTNALDPGPLKDGVNEIGATIAFTTAAGKTTSNIFAAIVQVDDNPKAAAEPASLALLGTGLAGLGLICRRRRER